MFLGRFRKSGTERWGLTWLLTAGRSEWLKMNSYSCGVHRSFVNQKPRLNVASAAYGKLGTVR